MTGNSPCSKQQEYDQVYLHGLLSVAEQVHYAASNTVNRASIDLKHGHQKRYIGFWEDRTTWSVSWNHVSIHLFGSQHSDLNIPYLLDSL